MEQLDLLRHTLDLLERLQIPYMVVGSFASGVYGEPRFTNDIDIVIDPSPQQLDQLCVAFPSDDYYVSAEAARDALRQRGQFNVIHPGSANKIDFMIARADAWGLEQVARRARVRLLPDREGYAARPEDLVISKLLYYREGGSEKHMRDITGMLVTSPEKIDREYIGRWATELGRRRVECGSGSFLGFRRAIGFTSSPSASPSPRSPSATPNG